MKKLGKKILRAIGTGLMFGLFMAKAAFAEITEGSITSAASQTIDVLFLIIGGAFIVLGVGSCIFAGYNLYQTMNEGGTGQASNKAAGGFAAGLVAFIIGLLGITVFKGIVKTGLGIG